MAAVADIAISITGNTAKLEAALGSAKSSISRFGSQAVSVGKLIGGAFAVGQLTRFAAEAVDLGDNMATLAERMQTSVETLSKLQYVAEQSNTSFDTLRTAMDQLANGLSKAEDGGGRARQSLADLRVDAEALTLLPIDQQLNVIADAFKNIATPADQTRIAMELFGGELGTQLLPILRQGSVGIRAMGDEAQRLGAVLSGETAAALQELDGSNKKIAASTRVFRAELTALIATPASAFIDGLAVSVGLLRAKLKGVAADFREAFGMAATGGPLENLQRDLAKINALLDMEGRPSSGPLREAQREIIALITQYERAAQAHDALIAKFNERDAAAASRKIPSLPEVVVGSGEEARAEAAQKALERERELRESLREQTRAAIELQAVWSDLEFRLGRPVGGNLDWEEFARENARGIEDALEASGDKFSEWLERESDKLSETIEGKTTEMTVFAEEAARNMQDAFAQFLFDPFQGGMKGMLRGFIDVLRRMVAEAAAAKIFEKLFRGSGGGGGFLGKLLGGLFKADGGPVSGGRPYVVGEKGPELFVPGASGQIVPNHAMGGPSISITNHIDARGSSISRAELNALLNHNSEVTVAKVRDLAGRGRI